MACEVKSLGRIHDLEKVQEYFGLHDENWLNAVHYAISPTSELIAFGQGEKLAFLSVSWDNKCQESSYALSWCGELEDPNQIISTIICLPMYGKSASHGAEWTCVAVGLSSGLVVFYTDAGIKIFSQSYHDDPVLYLKSFSTPRHSTADSIFYVIYDQCVCIIKGEEIFPMLISQRHYINRTMGRSSLPSTPNHIEADTIKFQKFKFARERETIINDAVVAGTQPPVTFDHIVEQTLACGYYARVTTLPVQSSLVLGVGAEPYLGFYYAEEGYKTISLGEVAKDVIGSAYKNILGNLFRRTPETATEELPPPPKETQMRTRCKFYDGKRDGFTIAIAPNGRLAAVTDNLDRVMLVDAQRGTLLRVWKGYRDVQCAFVPVKEKSLKGVQTQRRKALFLVIYVPRLGCLEIWALQNGPKVAAFTVSKHGQLAYNTHGLLAIQPGAKVKPTENCCLFLDPSDASIKEIQIPFHYALSETNSKTSRDIHLLRRLKNHLRDAKTTETGEEISELAKEFQTIEVRHQCLEMLKRNKQLEPGVFQAVLYAFDETLAHETDANEEHHNFQITVKNHKRLLDFYLAMKKPPVGTFDENLTLNDCDLVTINQLVLLLGNKEATSLAEANPKEAGGKVTFQEECKEEGDFVDYLSIFQLDLEGRIPLLRAKSDMFGYISGKLFGEFFTQGLCFEQFKRDAEDSSIPCEDLLILALQFWLEKPFLYQNCDDVIADMSRLAEMIRAICELAGERVNNYAYNAISPWWQDIREMLLESPQSLGLLVAIVCKTVATDLRRNCNDASCDEGSQTEDERWERISHDEAQWGLLLGKLEDIAILAAILEYPVISGEPIMPEVPYERPDCSLKAIVGGGKGIVTDLAAQWLINSRINPAKILEAGPSSHIEIKAVESQATSSTAEGSGDQDDVEMTESASVSPVAPMSNPLDDAILEKLTLLRDHFPFSLQSGVLLSLMSWHYMIYWSKNLHSLAHMRAAMLCLREFKTEDLALKHGMCCMLWNATLKYPLQSTMKLIQKVGRLPVDKMCQQDIEMSANLVPDFLELSLEFLAHFSSSLNHDERELKFEENLTEGPLPLQFLALQQHHAINELLQLHYELCAVLHFIAYFQLKVHKPITTVFDAMSNKAFFSDINKELSYVLPAPDMVLQQHREHFLCQVISASMDLIREDLQQLYVLDHAVYMDKIYALADSWKLDMSSLKRRRIVELYAHGYDLEAQKLLDTKVDDEVMGRELLEIAGKRLLLYASAKQEYYMKVASIGQQLLHYLDHLKETSARHTDITYDQPEEINIGLVAKLISNAYELLARRESKHLHIAAQMFDACSVLRE